MDVNDESYYDADFQLWEQYREDMFNLTENRDAWKAIAGELANIIKANRLVLGEYMGSRYIDRALARFNELRGKNND